MPVPPEIRAALASYGFETRRIELVSPLRERKGLRMAYRAEGADGRVIKARHCTSEDEARTLLELRAALEPAFAPVVARHGCVLLEEWIEGEPIAPERAESRAEEAGELLGRLHTTELPRDTAATCSTERWRWNGHSDIELLARADALAGADAERLVARLDREDPREARVSLVHRDFCGENMVVDSRGRLRLIDNERVGIDASGFDLGWTFHRWPMSSRAWSRFLGAYRKVAPSTEALAFWQIAAALTCSRVFLQRMPERLPESLARLRRFAAEGGA
jgi:hypothetical protein